MPSPQKQSFSVVRVQMHVPPPPQMNSSSEKHRMSAHPLGHSADWANAGTLRLVRTGADHATAAPAPTRFSILRREIPSSATTHPLSSPGTDKTLLARGGQRPAVEVAFLRCSNAERGRRGGNPDTAGHGRTHRGDTSIA